MPDLLVTCGHGNLHGQRRDTNSIFVGNSLIIFQCSENLTNSLQIDRKSVV